MSVSLNGRRALVTGASQGLGFAFTHALQAAGARVAVCDVQPTVLAVGADFASVADVSIAHEAAAFVEAAAKELGGLDLVISNAGIVRTTAPATDSLATALDDFESLIGTNTRGPFIIGRMAIPHLIAAGGGDIVNITTDHVHTCGFPEFVDHTSAPDCVWAEAPRPPVGGAVFDLYDASKWALLGLTKAWSVALREHGIRVNAFGMGATDTPLYRSTRRGRPMGPDVMSAAAVADVLIELLGEGPTGRTGDSVELWTNHPCRLPPPSAFAR